MALADEFVIFDDMQFTKRDWRNRNLIKTSNGLKWLTIPVEVKGKYYQKINETRVSSKTWNEDHLVQFKHNYRQAEYFKDVFPWMENLYLNCKFELLTEINQYFIEAIIKYLNINIKILRSEEFILADDRTERLVKICSEREASIYFTGPAAKSYINEELFKSKGISVNYFDYSEYPIYSQLNGNFEHSVTVFDLLLNEGKLGSKFMKYII